MKRSECTATHLEALGYRAMKCFSSWFNRNIEPCTAKKSKELFEAVVNIVRNGGRVDIRRNNMDYTVNIFLDETKFTHRGTEIVYFLSRPMTEAEKLEADLYTGRGRDWDYKTV